MSDLIVDVIGIIGVVLAGMAKAVLSALVWVVSSIPKLFSPLESGLEDIPGILAANRTVLSMIVLAGILGLVLLAIYWNRKRDDEPQEKKVEVEVSGAQVTVQQQQYSPWYGGYSWYNRVCPYNVVVPLDVWQAMHYLTKNCETELGGHLVVRQVEKNLVVAKLYVPMQGVTSQSYKPEYTDLLSIMPREDFSLIGGWFHSHASMGVCWSTDDERTIGNSIKVFRKYCVSIVMNKRGDYKIRVDVKEDNGMVQSYDDQPLRIISQENPLLEERCRLEIKQKVKYAPHTLWEWSWWGPRQKPINQRGPVPAPEVQVQKDWVERIRDSILRTIGLGWMVE